MSACRSCTSRPSALESIVRQLEAAWNAMDGSAFAAPFAAEADFVNIRGEHFRGQGAIAAGHAAIFQSIYVLGSAPPARLRIAPPSSPESTVQRIDC
jgi:uncharacterized protein (TIGR02246 family)